jgi:hypothetical protein
MRSNRFILFLASAAEVPGPQAGDGTKCYCGLDAFHGGQIATAMLLGLREPVLSPTMLGSPMPLGRQDLWSSHRA